MANAVFALISACLIVGLVLAGDKKHNRQRVRRLEVLILDVEAGAIKTKRELLARLRAL
jgi:hypothetical protein